MSAIALPNGSAWNTDNFYASEQIIKEKCRFGEGCLARPILTRTLSHDDWPIPFNLDPEKAFWKKDLGDE